MIVDERETGTGLTDAEILELGEEVLFDGAIVLALERGFERVPDATALLPPRLDWPF